MAITKQSQIIDKNTIFQGCDKLEAAFTDFTQSAKYLSEAAATCSPKALSVGNTSMQPVIEDLADSFYSYEKSIQKVEIATIDSYVNTQSLTIEDENMHYERQHTNKEYYLYEPNEASLDDELIFQLLSQGKYNSQDGTINGLSMTIESEEV